MRLTEAEVKAMRDYQWSLHGGRDPATTKVVKFPGNVRPIDYPRDPAQIIILPLVGRCSAKRESGE